MYLTDKVPLEGCRRDSGGNLVGTLRAARTGIQLYAGYEVGRPDLRVVRVYRPESEVFHADSMRSYAGAPITIDHPPESVTPQNWKDYARGELASEEIVRDGESVKVPFILRDAGAIEIVEEGDRREASMGYEAVLDWTPGTSPKGEAYDAVQKGIRINHLAVVRQARGGPSLRIGDSNMADVNLNASTALRTILVDGLQVSTTDAGAAAIEKLQGTITGRDAEIERLKGEVTTHLKAIETKDGEIEGLKQQVKDAAVTPEKLNDMATARAALITDAQKVFPKVDTAGKTDAEIRSACVAHKMGDAAIKDRSEDYIGGLFAALVPAGGAPSAPSPGTGDPLRAVIRSTTDADSLRAARDKARDSRYQRQPVKQEA